MHYFEVPDTNGYSHKKHYKGLHPSNWENQCNLPNSAREMQQLKRNTVTVSIRGCLKQNIGEPIKSDSDRKHPLQSKTVHFIKNSFQQTSLPNRKAENAKKTNSYIIEIPHRLNRKSLQQIQQTIQRIYRRRIALGFQKIKEQLLLCETSESDIGICQKAIYNYDLLPQFLQAYSNVYRLRYQHVMVEAFTKIAYEFKRAQQRQSALRQLLINDRKTQLCRLLKHKNKVMELNTLVKSMASIRFISRIVSIVKNKQIKGKAIIKPKKRCQKVRIDESHSLDNINMASTTKISRLLGNIKKQKQQPNENIYVKYNSPHPMTKFNQRMSENFPSTIPQLTDRIQRLQDMFADSRLAHSTKPYPTIDVKYAMESQKKFQPLHQYWSNSKIDIPSDPTQSKLSSNISSKDLINYSRKCQLTFCTCIKETKDYQLQCNLNRVQPMIKSDPSKLKNFNGKSQNLQIMRSQSVPSDIFSVIPQSPREVELVYVQETLLRPVLIEKPQIYQYRHQIPIYQQTILVRDLPKMTPDTLYMNNENRQPLSRRGQADNSIEKSISKRAKFLKVTVKQSGERRQ